jgi:thiol-disulfide isomerase/thioredoxin
MKYLGIFLSIVILGGVALALLKPPSSAGAGGGRGSGEFISHGDAVRFSEHLPDSEDQLVLFQFTADWCPGCEMIEPYVADLVANCDYVTRRKIDIVSWDSDAALQMEEYFDAGYIPFFALYDANGEALAAGDFDEVRRAIDSFARGW